MEERLTNTLKVERAKRDFTQAALAGLIGVTRKSINAIEKGHMAPSTLLTLKTMPELLDHFARHDPAELTGQTLAIHFALLPLLVRETGAEATAALAG